MFGIYNKIPKFWKLPDLYSPSRLPSKDGSWAWTVPKLIFSFGICSIPSSPATYIVGSWVLINTGTLYRDQGAVTHYIGNCASRVCCLVARCCGYRGALCQSASLILGGPSSPKWLLCVCVYVRPQRKYQLHAWRASVVM